jgi:hypothetical protein
VFSAGTLGSKNSLAGGELLSGACNYCVFFSIRHLFQLSFPLRTGFPVRTTLRYERPSIRSALRNEPLPFCDNALLRTIILFRYRHSLNCSSIQNVVLFRLSSFKLCSISDALLLRIILRCELSFDANCPSITTVLLIDLLFLVVLLSTFYLEKKNSN